MSNKDNVNYLQTLALNIKNEYTYICQNICKLISVYLVPFVCIAHYIVIGISEENLFNFILRSVVGSDHGPQPCGHAEAKEQQAKPHSGRPPHGYKIESVWHV